MKSLLPMLACNSVAMNPGKRDDVLVQSTQLLQHDLALALRYRVLHCLTRRLASHAVTVTLVRIIVNTVLSAYFITRIWRAANKSTDRRL